jgi:hypothetical protein
MSQTNLEIYNVLIDSGVSKNKAEKASKSIISREEALERIASKNDLLKLENKLLKTKSELIMWMVGLQIATIALIFTVLPNLI